MSLTPANRSGVAKAVRGSITMTSKPGEPGHRGQGLADVDGADHDEAHRRDLDGKEIGPALVQHSAAHPGAQPRLQRLRQGVGRRRVGRDQALVPAREVRHQDGGAPGTTLRVQRTEEAEPHQSTFST